MVNISILLYTKQFPIYNGITNNTSIKYDNNGTDKIIAEFRNTTIFNQN